MAFGFFRRRQKMVVVIMAVLMVSFLVGFQGLQALLTTSPGKVPLGQTTAGELLNGDVWSAAQDIDLLRYLGLAPDPSRQDASPMQYAFGQLLSQPQPATAYALGLLEAQKQGITVRDEDVEDLLREIGMAGDTYRGFVDQIRHFRPPVPESRLRQAVANWLRIYRVFARTLVHASPSERELRHAARDVYERVNLRVLHIEAKEFLADAPTPDQAKIEKQFEKFRNALSGAFTADNPFGFGYRQPNRVRIRYLLLSANAVRRAVRPTDKQIGEYYVAHKADADLQGPDGKLAPIAQVWEKLVDQLAGPIAREKSDRLLQQAQDLVTEYAQSGARAEATNALDYAHTKLLLPDKDVQAILNTKIGVGIHRQTLQRAADALAKEAKLDTIVFPLGQEGRESLDPDLVVTITGDMTLGAALEEAARQVKWPKVRWGTCVGLERALFSLADEDFPLVVKETLPLSAEAVNEDEILGSSFLLAEQKALTDLAFSALPFVPGAPGQTGRLDVGKDGPVLMVLPRYFRAMLQLSPESAKQMLSNPRGALLWQLTWAQPSYTPEKLTDELKKQVIDDLKLATAFAKAEDAALKIDTAAKFEAAVKDGKHPSSETRLFSRHEVRTLDAIAPPAAPNLPPQAQQNRQQKVQADFVRQAFGELLPANVEPPYPPKSKALASLALPAKREVLLLRRIGYEPLVESVYQQDIRPRVLREIEGVRWQQAIHLWFNFNNIVQRLEYRPEGR